MRSRSIVSLLILVAVLANRQSLLSAEDSTTSTPVRTPHQAIESGLKFLVDDTAKWRADRGCATCHHGTMSVWALNEAKAQGYAVNAETLSDLTQWTKSQFMARYSNPRDPRPGWNLVGIPAIYMGMMSRNLPVLSRAEIGQLAVHLSRHQEEDGTWLMPPPANGAPPIWESPETLALMALLAWETSTPTDPTEANAVRTNHEKAIEWLNKTEPSGTVQSNTLRLLLDVQNGKGAEQLQPKIEKLLQQQNADGGWSQAKEVPSDAFATGQALYALSCASVPNDRSEIQRAVAWLANTQKPDGSWPMTSRNHPGVESTRNPIRNPIPITYFGSAWAVIGLVRSVPTPADAASKQQQALDQIKAFHGKVEYDDTASDRPVIGVDLSTYEVSDDELANFARLLKSFPKLTALHLKSTKITDAGVKHLNGLLQLRKLSLENSTMTDVGLGQVSYLTALEVLNVKGTKVTDAGIAEVQQKLPNLKLER